MKNILIRKANKGDFAAILEINEAEVSCTSPMDEERLKLLDSLAGYHRVVVAGGLVVGFLLAMKSGAPFDNDNFAWFSEHYDHFYYIDRAVIKPGYQGAKLGTALYRDLFSFARKENVPLIGCEVYSFPPNERSLAFHASLGFENIGERYLEDRDKKVAMQALWLNKSPA